MRPARAVSGWSVERGQRENSEHEWASAAGLAAHLLVKLASKTKEPVLDKRSSCALNQIGVAQEIVVLESKVLDSSSEFVVKSDQPSEWSVPLEQPGRS